MAATVEVARAHPNPNIAPVMLIAHAGELRKYGSSTYKSPGANPPPAKPSTDKPPIRYATGNGGGTSASARRAAQPSRQLAIAVHRSGNRRRERRELATPVTYPALRPRK